jgi:Fe-S oxidoreductase
VFARRTLPRWFRRRPAGAQTNRGPLTFLADSFTSFTEPAVGIAAIELLERAGWDVRLEDSGCCGRAAFSKGLLDQAKRQASGLVDALAGTSGPIVGVEPSCLLTLRDEHRALLGDDPRVADVAGRARLVDELLVEAIDSGALKLREDAWPARQRILFHGHCHQKAEVGTAATMALLRRIPGAEVVELDAGCCGMAGSFGFEAEHYEVSMQVGADRLFPAVRAEPPSTVVAATGVSCRQQIAHGTIRRAHHPVELIRAALKP